MNRRLRRMIAALTGAGAAIPTYAEILRDTYGASEIYPLTNISSGTNIPAFVSAAHDGTLTGWDLKNSAGPVVGTLAPYLDGANDYSDIGSIALIWNGGIGGAFAFGKVSDVADWSDGLDRRLFNYKVDNNNWITFYKHATLGLFAYLAIGGVVKTRNVSTTTTDWFMFGATWKDSANGDEAIVYFNDAQQGAALTGFGAWSGTPTICTIGSLSVGASQVWKGWLGYHFVKFGSIWTPTNVADIYADRLTGGPDINP